MRKKPAASSKKNVEDQNLLRAIKSGEHSGKGSLNKVKEHLKRIPNGGNKS